MDRCSKGFDPAECPVALGVWVDGIERDGDEIAGVIRKWQPVCDQVDGACAKDYGIDHWDEA